MGVGMFAVLRPSRSYFHRNRPSSAATPTTPAARSWTYWRMPPTSATTMEEYPAVGSSTGAAHFQMTAPVVLFSATRIASLPPGVHTSFSPSTRGDSVYFPPPHCPPKSREKLLRHWTAPSATLTHTRSP